METKMKVCPRCAADNIVVREGGIGWGVKLYVSGVGFGMKATNDWVTHLCPNCGYFENYLTNKDWLNKIQADHQKSGWQMVE